MARRELYGAYSAVKNTFGKCVRACRFGAPFPLFCLSGAGGGGAAACFQFWGTLFREKKERKNENHISLNLSFKFIQGTSLNIYLPSALFLLLLQRTAGVAPWSRAVFLKHPTETIPIAHSPQATASDIKTQLSMFPFRFSWGYSTFLLSFPFIRERYSYPVVLPCSYNKNASVSGQF